jgi:hypothetical protein
VGPLRGLDESPMKLRGLIDTEEAFPKNA